MVTDARGVKQGGTFKVEGKGQDWRFELGSKIKKQLSEKLPVHGGESCSLKMYPIVTFAAQREERKASCLLPWTWVAPRLRTPEGWWGAIWKLQRCCVTHLYHRPLQSLAQFCGGDSSLIAVQLQSCSSMAYSSLLMAGAVSMETIFFGSLSLFFVLIHEEMNRTKYVTRK